MGLHVKGTLIAVDVAGGTSYVNIGNVASVMAGDVKCGVAEDTDLADIYRTRIPGFADEGQMTFRLRYIDSMYATLKNLVTDQATNGTIPRWRITFPMQPGDSVKATLTGLGILSMLNTPDKSVEGENILENDITVDKTGQWTFTEGS